MSHQHLQQLQTALLKAFPTDSSLTIMVTNGLGENAAIIAAGANLQERVFNLCQWVKAHDKIRDLLAAALAANSDNRDLQKLKHLFLLDPPLPNIRHQISNIASDALQCANTILQENQQALLPILSGDNRALAYTHLSGLYHRQENRGMFGEWVGFLNHAIPITDDPLVRQYAREISDNIVNLQNILYGSSMNYLENTIPHIQSDVKIYVSAQKRGEWHGTEQSGTIGACWTRLTRRPLRTPPPVRSLYNC